MMIAACSLQVYGRMCELINIHEWLSGILDGHCHKIKDPNYNEIKGGGGGYFNISNELYEWMWMINKCFKIYGYNDYEDYFDFFLFHLCCPTWQKTNSQWTWVVF